MPRDILVSQAVFHRKPIKRMKCMVAEEKRFTSRISDFKTPPCSHTTLPSVRSPFTVSILVVFFWILVRHTGKDYFYFISEERKQAPRALSWGYLPEQIQFLEGKIFSENKQQSTGSFSESVPDIQQQSPKSWPSPSIVKEQEAVPPPFCSLWPGR